MTIPEFTIREITPEEHAASLRKELEKDGLYKAIEARCDEINDECCGMTYVSHRYVQEQLCEILDLVRMKEGE